MPRYDGYHGYDDLPFQKGQEVIIPSGVTVKTMHPSRDSYTTSRKQKVRIHHFLPGQTVRLIDAVKDRHVRQIAQERFDMNELEAEVERDHAGAYDKRIPLQNPTLCWPGTGGYWCEVEINDVLEANGIVLDPAALDEPDMSDAQECPTFGMK